MQPLEVRQQAPQRRVRAPAMPEERLRQMPAPASAQGRRQPEVPVVEAADIAAVPADRLPDRAPVEAAIPDLVEVLEPGELVGSRRPHALDIAEVRAVGVDEINLRRGVQHRGTVLQHGRRDEVVGVERKYVLPARHGNAAVAAAAVPACGWHTSRMPTSPRAAMIRPSSDRVSSTLPSSTKIISNSRIVCASTLRTVSARKAAELKQGTTTDTRTESRPARVAAFGSLQAAVQASIVKVRACTEGCIWRKRA